MSPTLNVSNTKTLTLHHHDPHLDISPRSSIAPPSPSHYLNHFLSCTSPPIDHHFSHFTRLHGQLGLLLIRSLSGLCFADDINKSPIYHLGFPPLTTHHGKRNGEFRKEEEQDTHIVCSMWSSEFPSSEESLFCLCFSCCSHPKVSLLVLM